MAGLPRPVANKVDSQSVKYQRFYHLNPENLAPYDALTFPSLQARWQAQPPSGELVAVSAAIAGGLVGLAVAQVLADATVEMLS